MDPNAMVNDELANGRKLIETLISGGLDVRLAFWVKRTDADDWRLYLSTPLVDDQGPAVAHRTIFNQIRRMPEYGIDPESVGLVGMNDSATTKAMEAVPARNPYPRITRYSGSSFNGMDVDGVYIYPPFQAA